MEDKAEYDSFYACHEGGDSKVDVVVRRCLAWAEKLAVQEVENKLQG